MAGENSCCCFSLTPFDYYSHHSNKRTPSLIYTSTKNPAPTALLDTLLLLIFGKFFGLITYEQVTFRLDPIAYEALHTALHTTLFFAVCSKGVILGKIPLRLFHTLRLLIQGVGSSPYAYWSPSFYQSGKSMYMFISMLSSHLLLNRQMYRAETL